MSKNQKYLFIYLSLFVYLVSICGVTINKHFCGGELESVTLIKKSSCCEGETEDEADGCCNNETIYLSNKTESLSNNGKFSFDPVFYSISNNSIPGNSFYSFCHFQPSVFSFTSKPPFLARTNHIALMVFRI